MINYIITPKLHSHTYKIVLQFMPSTEQSQLKLPTWIPGSYMIREFSKNIISINAYQNNQPISCNQINKNTWILDNYKINEFLQVEYEVYALDFGIRTAYLDTKRGYFNNTSLCLYIVGLEHVTHTIEFKEIPKTWNIATGLHFQDNKYVATNYNELIDCPFELGEFIKLSFKVKDTVHYMVLSGTVPSNFDSNKLIHDVTKICETQINLFGGQAPFSNYTFMLYLGGEIYTGLEHSNSTALMAPYYSLPTKHSENIGDDYLKLLGLISHEYFHLWNVKRIKPQVFNPYDFENENYTKLLWWFEGITSYYDDLILYRSGLIDKEKYLKIILDNINAVYKYDGVNIQSLTNSSLTAWIKYYRQDENSPNSVVSYYVKGSLVGLCLDLLIRKQGNKSLDDVLLGLYNKWQDDSLGINEIELPELIKKYTNCELTSEITSFTETCDNLPLTEILNHFGIKLEDTLTNYTDSGKVLNMNENLPKPQPIGLGARTVKESTGYRILNIYNNSIAQNAGLAANDIIIAIDNIKLNDLDKQLSLYNAGDVISLSVFRQEQLMTIKLTLQPNMVKTYYLKIFDDKKLTNWL